MMQYYLTVNTVQKHLQNFQDTQATHIAETNPKKGPACNNNSIMPESWFYGVSAFPATSLECLENNHLGLRQAFNDTTSQV